MANIIFKSNTGSDRFTIEQKSFKMPFDDNIVELLITPKKSYSIDAKDFYNGIIPSQISKVEFENLGEKVVALVFISRKISLKRNLILDIPISGTATFKQDSFNITETIFTSGEVLVSGFSPNEKSIIDNKTNYIIKNPLGKESLVFSRTFSVTKKYTFAGGSDYNIVNNADKYRVVKKVKKDNNNKIISKTFDFYYKSPNIVTNPKDTEINFSINSVSYSKNKSSSVYQELDPIEIKNKIYSIDTGRDPGAEGGMKRIVIKGHPGSKYSFLISDADGNMYDTNTGVLSSSGGLVEGVIPQSTDGKSYGESVIKVSIPRSSGVKTVTTKLIKEEEIESVKAKIKNAVDTAEVEEIVQPIKIKKKKVLSLTVPTLTFGVTSTGYLGPKVKIITAAGVTETSQLVFLGNESRETLKITKPGQYKFSFVVSSGSDNKIVQITRQPLFAMPEDLEDNYVAWDSDNTKKRIAQKADGTVIPSDWDWSSVEKGASIKIKAAVNGIGKILSTDAISGVDHYAYSHVNVVGIIDVGEVGEAYSTVNLRLDKFLSTITPS